MTQIPEASGMTPKSPTDPASAHAVVSNGWLGANSTFEHADERKMGRAMSASLGVHGAGVLLFMLVMAWRPPAPPPTITPIENYELVFVQMEGPGGGGGGGGNESPDPPARLEMKAEIPEAPKVVMQEVELPPPPPPPPLMAPIRTAPTLVPTAGTVTGLGAAPSAGSGTGGGGGTGQGTGSGPGTGSGVGPGSGGGFGGGAFQPGTGASNPEIIR